MKPFAVYNEIDPAAVHVLREMIKRGVIADGIVDDRSIKEVGADDYREFTQVHFFAGGGFWSIAARRAGWSDDRPIWSASCPCQPYSAAGKQGGDDDPRNLWPDLFRIVRSARRSGFGPAVLVGEQVAGKAGYVWFRGVRADLATEGYRARSVDFPACAVNAPHQRNRQYWVALADADQPGQEMARYAGNFGATGSVGTLDQRSRSNGHDLFGPIGTMADAERQGKWRRRFLRGPDESGGAVDQRSSDQFAGPLDGRSGAMADAESGFSGRNVEVGRPEGRTADRRFDARSRHYKPICEYFSACHDPNRCDGQFAACPYRDEPPAGWEWSDDDGWQRSYDLFGPLVDAARIGWRERVAEPTIFGRVATASGANPSNGGDMADADRERPDQIGRNERKITGNPGEIRTFDPAVLPAGSHGTRGILGHAVETGLQGFGGNVVPCNGQPVLWRPVRADQPSASPGRPVAAADGGELADADKPIVRHVASAGKFPEPEPDEKSCDGNADDAGYWDDAQWIVCHDGKARRTKPGIRFLANGIPGRVDLWSIGGNAIVPEAATQVIVSLIDVL